MRYLTLGAVLCLAVVGTAAGAAAADAQLAAPIQKFIDSFNKGDAAGAAATHAAGADLGGVRLTTSTRRPSGEIENAAPFPSRTGGEPFVPRM
jgi:hypothetical protein